MPEGLFSPTDIETPFPHERVLSSLVRTRTHIYWAVTLLGSEDEAEAFRASLPSRKAYLREGALLWHVVLSAADLDEIRSHPGQRLRPGLYEITRALDGVSPPAHRVVPTEGQAAAFFVSIEGHMLTNYHVAREEIEPAGRTGGACGFHPFRYLSFDVPELAGARVTGYRLLPRVELLANLSEADWKAGWDVALLRSPTAPVTHLDIAPKSPAIGDEVWAYGFPMRTSRPPERLAGLGYRDADHSLRVSHGHITEWSTDHNFVADMDGLAGNSGGPVLSHEGRVVGIFWNVYPHEGADQRPERFEGGVICVAARPAVERLRGMCPEEMECL